MYPVVMPDGRTLPCHGTTHITTMRFDSVRERPVGWIWNESSAFQAFRGMNGYRNRVAAARESRSTSEDAGARRFALTGMPAIPILCVR